MVELTRDLRSPRAKEGVELEILQRGCDVGRERHRHPVSVSTECRSGAAFDLVDSYLRGASIVPLECPRLGNTNFRSADIPPDQFSSSPQLHVIPPFQGGATSSVPLGMRESVREISCGRRPAHLGTRYPGDHARMA